MLSPVDAESTPNTAIHPFQRDNLLEDLIDLSSEHPPWTSDHAEVSPLAIPSSSHVLLAQPLVGSIYTCPNSNRLTPFFNSHKKRLHLYLIHWPLLIKK